MSGGGATAIDTETSATLTAAVLVETGHITSAPRAGGVKGGDTSARRPKRARVHHTQAQIHGDRTTNRSTSGRDMKQCRLLCSRQRPPKSKGREGVKGGRMAGRRIRARHQCLSSSSVGAEMAGGEGKWAA